MKTLSGYCNGRFGLVNYAGLNTCDATNGEGLRVSLFVSGCSMNCKGCFNKEAQDPNYGRKFDCRVQKELLEALGEPYIDGLSLLGGDPLEPCNIVDIELLVATVKLFYPDKTIWLWTGRKYEDVQHLPLMQYIDVIVDGAFIERKKCNEQWKGSSNQRVIWLQQGVQ